MIKGLTDQKRGESQIFKFKNERMKVKGERETLK